MLFDLEAGIGAINRIHENNATIEDIYRQVVAVMAYKKLAPVAEKLSNLVMASRIDTKKQGNTIVQQIHYVNNYNQLIYAKSNGWYISDGPGEGLEGTDALKYFFENTFLDSKLNKSFYLLRDIFSEQSFAASHEFDDIFHEVMERMFGYVEDDNGIRYYTAKVNGDTVNKIGNCIDAILRTRAMLAYSHVTQTPPLLIGDNWLGERKSMGVQPERGLLGESIDLTCGGDKSAVVEKIKFLMFGNDQIGSLFTRVANLI